MLQGGGSAQPSPIRPFLEIAFDEVGISDAVTANQAKADEAIAPSSSVKRVRDPANSAHCQAPGLDLRGSSWIIHLEDGFWPQR